MKTRIRPLLAMLALVATTTVRAQEIPPPPPTPDIGAGQSAAQSAPYTAPAPQPAAPPSAYQAQPAPVYSPAPPPGVYQPAPYQPVYATPPPGTVLVPAQPYAPYPPYVQPLVLVPAPPLANYEWGAAVDALFLERSVGCSFALGDTYYNPSSHMPPAQPTGTLYSDDAQFPLAAGVRLELSRKLTDNVTLSATYWGLQQWSVSSAVYGDPNNYTVLADSPYLQLPALLNGLDDSLGYTYESQIENVEANLMYRVGSPSPYWQFSWLWGVRYVNLSEQFTLTGVDDGNAAIENLSSNTTNNLLGLQGGVLFVRGWDRFQWETGLKFGLMANIYRQHLTDSATEGGGPASGFVPYEATNNGTALAGMFELTLGAKIRLSDNLWLRLGYQVYDFTGLALAPRQLSAFGHGGNVAFDGLSIGMQATW